MSLILVKIIVLWGMIEVLLLDLCNPVAIHCPLKALLVVQCLTGHHRWIHYNMQVSGTAIAAYATIYSLRNNHRCIRYIQYTVSETNHPFSPSSLQCTERKPPVSHLYLSHNQINTSVPQPVQHVSPTASPTCQSHSQSIASPQSVP